MHDKMQTGIKYAHQNSRTRMPVSSPPAMSALNKPNMGIMNPLIKPAKKSQGKISKQVYVFYIKKNIITKPNPLIKLDDYKYTLIDN